MSLRYFFLLAFGLPLLLGQQLAWAQSGERSPDPLEKRDQGLQVVELRIVQQTSEIHALKSELERQSAEFERLNKARNSWWNGYAVPVLPIFGAVFTAIGGWFVTYLLLQQNFKNQDKVRSDESRQKEDERKELYLVEALRYFEGRTQKRSIGIAFIEAYWDEVTRLHKTWTAVLANQAIYLLSKLSTDHKLEVHEFDNLNRIFELLNRADLQDSQRERIREVVKGLSEDESPAVKEWKDTYPKN